MSGSEKSRSFNDFDIFFASFHLISFPCYSLVLLGLGQNQKPSYKLLYISETVLFVVPFTLSLKSPKVRWDVYWPKGTYTAYSIGNISVFYRARLELIQSGFFIAKENFFHENDYVPRIWHLAKRSSYERGNHAADFCGSERR